VNLPEIQTITAIVSDIVETNNGYLFIFVVVNSDTLEETGRFISVKAECRNAFYTSKTYKFDISA
jgi:hypothetical protein